MRRLVFLVVGIADEHRGQAVEGQHPVGLGIVDARRLVGVLQRFVVAVGGCKVHGALPRSSTVSSAAYAKPPQRPYLAKAGRTLRTFDNSPHSQLCSTPLRSLYPPRVFPGQRLRQRFSGEHAGLHRGVRALDLRHVQKAGPVAQQQPAGEAQLRQRLDAALDQRPGAVGDAAAALEMLAHMRVGLEALHFVERRQPGVGVVQPDDKAIGHQVGAEVIQERSAVGGGIQRPAERMLDQPRLVVGGGDLPQLLDADAIGLRVLALAQVESRHQLLGQRAAAAFGEQRIVGAQLHAALELSVGLPSLPMPMSPVAMPAMRPSSSSNSVAAKPG